MIFFLFTQNMTTFNDENGKDQSWSLQILQFRIFCPELLDIKGKNKVQLWRLSFVCFCLRKQGNNKLTNIYKDSWSWVISRICEQHLCLPWGKQEVYWKVTNVDVKAHPCFCFFPRKNVLIWVHYMQDVSCLNQCLLLNQFVLKEIKNCKGKSQPKCSCSRRVVSQIGFRDDGFL